MAENTYGIVDIIANDVLIASNVQLDGTPTLYQYDIPTMTPGINSLTINLKNPKAVDNDGNGQYNDPGDEAMGVTMSNLAVANDNVTFVEYLPRPAGHIYDSSGNIVGNISAVNEFVSWGMNYSHIFIVNA